MDPQNLAIQIQDLQLSKKPQRSQNINNPEYMQKQSFITNLFRLQFIQESTEIYQYSFKIDGIEQDSREMYYQIYRQARQQITEQFGQGIKLFRGQNFWCYKKHPKQQITIQTQLNDQQYTITMSLRNSFDLNIQNEETKSIISQIYNIKVKNCLQAMGYVEIGKNAKYYNIKNPISNKLDQYKLNIWQGYTTSTFICPSAAKLLIDFNSRVLRTDTALDFINSFKDDKKAALAFQGLSVMASYGNNAIYKIDSIDLEKTPESVFTKEDGSKISYLQYFCEARGQKIQCLYQPLLKCIQKRKKQSPDTPPRILYFIPELMLMTGLRDDQRNDYRIMKEVSNYTKKNPADRMSYINQFVNRMKTNLQEFHIQIDQNQNISQGFVMEPPYISTSNAQSIQPQKGLFDPKDIYSKSVQLQDWWIIYQSSGQGDDEYVDNLISELDQSSKKYGIKVHRPCDYYGYICPPDNKPDTWKQYIKGNLQNYQQQGNDKPSFIISLIDVRDKGKLYKPLKELLYKELGIPHQNIVKQSLNKNKLSVLSKILLQITSKITYPLWKVEKPEEIKKGTMLIGIDQYHKTGKQNCVGFVSTIDQNFVLYYSNVYMQSEDSDMNVIPSLSQLIKKALTEYFHSNQKTIPENIIIYRDGVGGSQMKITMENEVRAIQLGFSQFSNEYKPKMAYIIVNKLVNLRYFIQDSQSNKYQQGRGGKGNSQQIVNPPSGSVIADDISENFEFYLAAQQVTSGTCTPTKYTVAYNTTTYSEDTFWRLTYYQCFNYFNWSGAVKVPAPLQYAHKLCYLVGETFKSQPSEELCDSLYYL